MTIKKVFRILGATAKSLLLATAIFAALTSVVPATKTQVINPLSTVGVEAGLLNDISLLGYKCLFPADGSRDGSCPGGGKALFSEVEQWLINIAGAIAVLVIIWGGYRYFIGTLTEDKEAGRKTIRAGVVGLSFVMLAGLIRDLVKGTFQTDGSGQVTLSTEAVVNVVKNFLGIFIPLAAVVAVGFLVYGGFLLLTSAGNEEQSKKGMGAIKNSVIGLIVVLLAATMVQIINVIIKSATGS